MIKLSVAIITYNEENNIGRCLHSVQNIADEIVVVDSFSTDKTAQICQKMGAKVITHTFVGHIEQKNYALTQTNYDYVLSLDGDEELGPELIAEIKEIKQNSDIAHLADGYFFNRLTNYAGHWVRYCGWYPDRKLRLFNKHKGQWSGVNPHDIIRMDVNASINYISKDILHYSYASISAHVAQTNKFTSIAAKAAFANGVRSNIFKIITRPFFKFIRDYFLKLGILDGRYGLIICSINSLSALLKYAKIFELQLNKKID
ncbi:MAG: glycosyl transferase [Bdellovibrionales bacterium RIFOXYD12_FULL_39_22]|nr:MAG: glycosyl transferase [Bdellovibrionales bacterium RIFOXYB1_FULL_39_21]OFZ43003.1 MAG: glycosyl transferase [Bdellovibrionales bacterium RIFOXYC12_FULL_39_17]OFZ50911.1 MAG: glycosyl transferase [Bdellovibrionales bacterium RIFOXYC1_FULL_39_130]OFZ78134.1 MAG: glycosyl transferase [Bdellovibrionales bacterium RIFOXYD1_FULL_39_84]OFZ94002.1 MAG: glycosyl transferase [Bdellovibrionales bacterium RIFOXYD12_FULL_39_22]HLE10453.1 glycosyltransferase family 2 protein [Bacteriovoracaceae bacte